MNYTINLTLTVDADSYEEAKFKAGLFMPWSSGSKWITKGHQYLEGVDHWTVEDLDIDEFDAILLERGWR